jgi:uncharacterized protein (DUF433 family)/DNA-binding transcriptional MerR regulator
MNLIGVGLYTFQEAAKLTSVPAQDLRRWLKGRAYNGSTSGKRTIPPLWKTELAEAELDAVSFHDLLEIRFVRAFQKFGVSTQTIRLACENARQLFNHPYPFTSKRFKTDGRTIFAEALEETGDRKFLDLAKKQYALSKIIEPSLYKGIEFGSSELAIRWYPLQRSRSVVLDPTIAFGKPIISASGIRTSILYDAFKAEKDKKFVARLYDVPVSAVNTAIRYETELLAA